MHQAVDYYARDEEMNLNVEHILINHLKKLGYYQFNYSAKIHEYIKNETIDYIRKNYNEIKDMNVEEIQNIVKSSDKYKSFVKYLQKHEIRAKIFENCVYSDFYNLCTIDELEYLGW
jgi:hypothetical protein